MILMRRSTPKDTKLKRSSAEVADATPSRYYLTNQQILDSEALPPLQTQGREVQIMTIDDNDVCVGIMIEDLFSILEFG